MEGTEWKLRRCKYEQQVDALVANLLGVLQTNEQDLRDALWDLNPRLKMVDGKAKFHDVKDITHLIKLL